MPKIPAPQLYARITVPLSQGHPPMSYALNSIEVVVRVNHPWGIVRSMDLNTH